MAVRPEYQQACGRSAIQRHRTQARSARQEAQRRLPDRKKRRRRSAVLDSRQRQQYPDRVHEDGWTGLPYLQLRKRKLQQELRAKRIATDIINQVFADDETDELEVLRQLVVRKSARYPDKLKFMQYLARQGYGYDDIKTVLDESNN